MTNGEKFKTASERKTAYLQYCDDYDQDDEGILGSFDWLDAEYIVKLKSCPFCGSEARLISGLEDHFVICCNDECAAAIVARSFSSPEEATAAWNKRAK